MLETKTLFLQNYLFIRNSFYIPSSRIFDHCAARGSKPLTKQGMKRRCKNFRVIDATHPEKSVYFLSKGQTMKTFWREFTALSVSVCESILHSVGFLKFWLRFHMKYGNLGENLMNYLFIICSSYFNMLWIMIHTGIALNRSQNFENQHSARIL